MDKRLEDRLLELIADYKRRSKAIGGSEWVRYRYASIAAKMGMYQHWAEKHRQELGHVIKQLAELWERTSLVPELTEEEQNIYRTAASDLRHILKS